jgi:Ca-activated chloride channel family protein
VSPLDGFRFADPAWLWAMLLGPLALAVALVRERHGRAVVFPGVNALGANAGWRTRLRHAPAALFALALVLGAVALARPQWGSVKRDVTTSGVDIVVALDVSGSMAAEDFQPKNRLAVAKQVVADFVERRRSDRVGLVIFAGQSLTKAPPTTDNAVLLRQLEDVRLDVLPDGTAIGSGLATALTRLRRSKAKSRVVVLVTDGANNSGEIDPATAADMAKALEVRVYTVCVGRGGRVPMPVQVQDSFTGRIVRQTAMVDVQIDEALLQRIADRTGGEFFRATDSGSLKAIFERIDRLEKSEIRTTAFQRYRELFPRVLAGALAALALSGLLFAAGLRVAPA